MTVAVIPELEPMLLMATAMPPLDFSDIAALRAQADEGPEMLLGLYVPTVDDVTTEVIEVPVPGGAIELRVHRPDRPAPLPILVSIHGGGWILGRAVHTDLPCRRLASLSGSVVVAVDYRLAPEHPFPGPVEDCYAAVEWVVAQADRIGGDPTDVAVSGGSAGANLAAAVALMCRDRGGPALSAQWLDVPAVDLTLPDDESLLAFGQGFGLDRAGVVTTISLYAAQEDLTNPYCSPLLSPDLSGLPPAVITTAGCDPLRSQGERYAAALEAAGNHVRYSSWPGHLHATMQLVTLADSCRDYEAEVLAALSEARSIARGV
jgi:acetyl esterase